MKIIDVRTVVLGTSWRNLIYVELQTDDGHTGIGEVRMVNQTDAVLGYLAEAVPNHVLGADPFEIEALVDRLRRRDYARPGQVEMSGLGALEIACWDIVGKALGQPVYRLLGGAMRDRIKAYANGWYRVPRTPEAFAGAARGVVEKGYQALKVDPFGPGAYELDRAETMLSLSLVEAVRGTVGPDVELFIEMHGRFTPGAAIRMAKDLAQFDPAWIEEPVPPENVAALADVRRAVDIPVAAGERLHTRWEFREVFEQQAADIVQPDITNFGGILETRKLAATAETYYTLIAPHNVGGPVSTAAALHLAAVTPNFKIQEHFNDFADTHVKRAAPGLPEVVDGYWSLPEGPGLGVEVDWQFIAENPRRAVMFDLFKHGWELREAEQVIRL